MLQERHFPESSGVLQKRQFMSPDSSKNWMPWTGDVWVPLQGKVCACGCGGDATTGYKIEKLWPGELMPDPNGIGLILFYVEASHAGPQFDEQELISDGSLVRADGPGEPLP